MRGDGELDRLAAEHALPPPRASACLARHCLAGVDRDSNGPPRCCPPIVTATRDGTPPQTPPLSKRPSPSARTGRRVLRHRPRAPRSHTGETNVGLLAPTHDSTVPPRRAPSLAAAVLAASAASAASSALVRLVLTRLPYASRVSTYRGTHRPVVPWVDPTVSSRWRRPRHRVVRGGAMVPQLAVRSQRCGASRFPRQARRS